MPPNPDKTRDRWRRNTRAHRARMTPEERRRRWRDARRTHRAKAGTAALASLVNALPEADVDRLLAVLDPAPETSHA